MPSLADVAAVAAEAASELVVAGEAGLSGGSGWYPPLLGSDHGAIADRFRCVFVSFPRSWWLWLAYQKGPYASRKLRAILANVWPDGCAGSEI
jgi:hypothetical protein